MHLYKPSCRVLVLLLLGVAMGGLAGCRVEIGKDPNPTPTPSPTPTPTPTPTPSSSVSLSSAAFAAPAEGSLAARVATAGAEYFEGVTAAAVEETMSVRRAISRAAEVPAEAGSQLLEAQKSLSAASDAYRKAEATVFMVDPDSVEELRAQPDPLRAASQGGRDETMAELAAALEKMDALLARPLDAGKAETLLAEAQGVGAKIDKLEAGLRGLADAWSADDAKNFRQQFFLSSSMEAVARMFQGLLAMTGDLVPGRLSSPDDPAEISSRLTAVKEIYLGDKEGTEQQPSPHLLVQQASVVQAALTRASIARAAALAGVLELAPQDDRLRAQLGTSLADVTRQLTFAAESLGIVIVAQK